MVPETATITSAATFEKNIDNTKIGTGDIANPVTKYKLVGTLGCHISTFNYIYFGKYDSKPVKYRVLNKKSNDFGVQDGSLFLDCDNVLVDGIAFNSHEKDAKKANLWSNSDIKAWFNSDAFLNNTDCFTVAEKSAIAECYKTEKGSDDYEFIDTVDFAPLTGEQIFALDCREISSDKYGYCANSGTMHGGSSYNRGKKDQDGNYKSYFLRTSDNSVIGNINEAKIYTYYVTYINGPDTTNNSTGSFCSDMPKKTVDFHDKNIGISPALNIELSSILFSSVIFNSSDGANEYKLTILDDGLSANITSGQKITSENRIVKIPYSVTGNPNRLSLLITDKPYSDSSASIKYYSPIISGNIDSKGNVSIDMPENYNSNDKVYIIAEKTNDMYSTDYASKPFDITDAIKNSCTTVTFDPCGGEMLESSAKTNLYRKLEALPTPTFGNYEFVGWFTKSMGGERVTTDTVFASDQTIYARWAHYLYTNVNYNNATFKHAASTNYLDRLDELPANPVRKGYRFDGWFTDKIGGNEITTETIFKSNIYAYAHWTLMDHYKISFDANGGSVSYESDITGEDLKLASLPTPTRDKYDFVGWFTQIDRGDKVTIDTAFDKDQTIYAHWLNKDYKYLDLEGNYIQSDPETKAVEDVNKTGGTTVWSNGWYIVSKNTAILNRIVIEGTVNLILSDGATLTAERGINVPKDTTLIIWPQKEETGSISISLKASKLGAGIGGNSGNSEAAEGFGSIYINGGNINIDAQCAAIGGGSYSNSGNITINRGNINAECKSHAAAIGAGRGGSVDSIVINGGTVNAKGDSGPGIGSCCNDMSCEIRINGGSVYASSEKNSAGIGGCQDAYVGLIEINGGTVEAYGAQNGGAGIGGGERTTDDDPPSSTGIIRIQGGTVKSQGYAGGAGIGGSASRRYIPGEAGDIIISGGTVTAIGAEGGAGIGGGGYTVGTELNGGSVKKIDILGGKVTAISDKGYGIGPGRNINDPKKDGAKGDLTLGWKTADDYIAAASIVAQNYTLNSDFYYRLGKEYYGAVTVENLPEKDPSYILTPAPETYQVTVTNGSGNGSYIEGTNVTITADSAPEGQEFDKWTSEDEVTFADASATSTTFVMPAKDVAVTAVYKEKKKDSEEENQNKEKENKDKENQNKDNKDGKENPVKKDDQKPETKQNIVKVEGVGTFSEDGTILKDTDGDKYYVSGKVKPDKFKKNMTIADKKSGGKYKITKLTKKKGKVIGGTVTYMKPYNKNCKIISATGKVKLSGVTFTVTVIAPNCAKNCKKLTTVVLGGNIKTIGKNAFNGCSNLKSITIKSKTLKKKSIGANAFKGIHPKAKVKVPKSVHKSYESILKARGLKGKKQKVI